MFLNISSEMFMLLIEELFFFLFEIIYCVCVCTPEDMNMYHVYGGIMEARRGCQIPWNPNFRWLWEAVSGWLGMKPGPSIRAVSALKCRAIFPTQESYEIPRRIWLKWESHAASLRCLSSAYKIKTLLIVFNIPYKRLWMSNMESNEK